MPIHRGTPASKAASLNRVQSTSSPSCSLCFSCGEFFPLAVPHAADNGASAAALRPPCPREPRVVPPAAAVRRCGESRPDRRLGGAAAAPNETPRAANASSDFARRPCPHAARRTIPSARAASCFRNQPTKIRAPRPRRAARKLGCTRLRDGAAARRETFVGELLRYQIPKPRGSDPRRKNADSSRGPLKRPARNSSGRSRWALSH